MLVRACARYYRGRDTRDLRDSCCRCNSCLYIMPPVLYGRSQTRELSIRSASLRVEETFGGFAGDESRELREKINPRVTTVCHVTARLNPMSSRERFAL